MVNNSKLNSTKVQLIDRISFYDKSIKSIESSVCFHYLETEDSSGISDDIMPDCESAELFAVLKPILLEVYTGIRDKLQNELNQL